MQVLFVIVTYRLFKPFLTIRLSLNGSSPSEAEHCVQQSTKAPFICSRVPETTLPTEATVSSVYIENVVLASRVKVDPTLIFITLLKIAF